MRQYLGIPEIALYTSRLPAMHLGHGPFFIPDTNSIERLYLEFRRRVKTQGSFPSEAAALTLLYGLVASGQVCFRKLEGWQDMGTALTTVGPTAQEAA